MRFFAIALALPFLYACCTPSLAPSSGCAFPQSVTETHTKTTLVMPPSYQTAMISPPSLYQAPPVAQAPVASPCVPQFPAYQSTTQTCADPCSYTISVPPPTVPKYTVALPATPPPQYTIAIPQAPLSSPQCSIVQAPATVQQAPLKSNPCE